MSEPTEEDLKAALEWLKANASPDPYGSWRMFEKSTIRLRHDLARFRAQAREAAEKERDELRDKGEK